MSATTERVITYLLVEDDNGHAEHYWADVVLNQNIHASERLYARREATTGHVSRSS